ncbi:alanyl-tRNA editing protein [Aquibacillus sediminis]|uniref:alanyl-tRNA editing protein n=1 Tax=Aquibacillus sediminis TaxID=2574734 RepID=UPI00110921EF|nr:DHHA1 domain-containing protein [Aquibacillus sediminis]
MSTEKLYYQDTYMCKFTAKVNKRDIDEKGQYVVLEQTAFYPTGGGQPYDTGNISGVKVYDVEEVDGEIRHYIESPLELGEIYSGKIDWDRRFDHMQQHAGQHILSAAFEDHFGYKTVSFHLGKEVCSIDLAIDSLNDREANQVESIANQITMENRSIETKWVSEQEAANYPLRKDLSVNENIRLVIIPNFDYNGCGGTHPNATGQVGAIKILNWEKQKKKLRLYFVCGNRVMQQLDQNHKVMRQLTDLFNAPQKQLVEVGRQTLQQTKDLEKSIDELKAQLMEHEADELINDAKSYPQYQLVQAIFQQRPMTEVQYLAKTVAMKMKDCIVTMVNQTDQKTQIVCATSEEVTIDANVLLKNVLPLIEGKGGGTASFAQGGGNKKVSSEQMLQAFADHLREM